MPPREISPFDRDNAPQIRPDAAAAVPQLDIRSLRDERFGHDPATEPGPKPSNQEIDYTNVRNHIDRSRNQTTRVEDNWHGRNEADMQDLQTVVNVMKARNEEAEQNKATLRQLRSELMGAKQRFDMSVRDQQSRQRTASLAYQEHETLYTTYQATKARIELVRDQGRKVHHSIGAESNIIDEHIRYIKLLNNAGLSVTREAAVDPPWRTQQVDELIQKYAVSHKTDPNVSQHPSALLQDAVQYIERHYIEPAILRKQMLDRELMQLIAPLDSLRKEAQNVRVAAAKAKIVYERHQQEYRDAEKRTYLITGEISRLEEQINQQPSPSSISLVDAVKQVLDARKQQPVTPPARPAISVRMRQARGKLALGNTSEPPPSGANPTRLP